MTYGDLPASAVWELLPRPLRERFDAAVDRLEPLLSAGTDTGLIHADLHLGNAVFSRDQVALIDFDDSGFGPRLYDLAVALWEMRLGPDYEQFKDALLASYSAERDIDYGAIDDFIALRQVSFALRFTGMANVNPHFAKRLNVIQRWSNDILTAVGY